MVVTGASGNVPGNQLLEGVKQTGRGLASRSGAQPSHVTVTSRRTAAFEGRLTAPREGVKAVFRELIGRDVASDVARAHAFG
jgi:hypothetical protein